jgi:beta-glucanase (GH16 family)
MWMRVTVAGLLLFLMAWICGCGSGSSSPALAAPGQVAAPVVTTRPAQQGALIIALGSTTPGAVIHYTVDGKVPTSASPIYQAPFLVAANVKVQACASFSGDKDSAITSQSFATNIPSGTLVWSDEFTNTTGHNQQPDPTVWGYDVGNSGWGNHELEDYCAWGSATAPCDAANPNAYIGLDNALHIVARKTASGSYTSARMKSEGLFSLQYGRLEAKIWVPEGQGIWPAFWTLGNHVATAGWPASGEQDIMERVDGPLSPDWNEGSIHGPGFTGDVGLGTKFYFPKGQTAGSGWHTYGIIWAKSSVAYYIDDPTKPYVTYTNPGSIAKFKDAVWPFDTGDSAFLLINMAVGGDWPGPPNKSTVFPADLKVDYVRIYTN